MPDSSRYRVLIIGDVVGRPGRDAVKEVVPAFRERFEYLVHLQPQDQKVVP